MTVTTNLYMNSSIIFDDLINNNAVNFIDDGDWIITETEDYVNKPIYNWVNDDAVIYCYNCKEYFTFFIRKHHCRLCGRIFCYKCSNNFVSIPFDSQLPHKINTVTNLFHTYSNDKKERVCINCNLKINDKIQIDKLLLMFKFLSIKDIKNLSSVSRLWYKACMHYFTLFRGIQYKFFSQELSQYEHDMLLCNANFLAGHNKWMFNLLKINYFQQDFLTQKRITNCKNILCNSQCKQSLETHEIILIFVNNYLNDSTTKYLLDNLNLITDIELSCYLPLFIYMLTRGDTNIVDFFLFKFNNTISFEIIWEMCRNKIMFNFIQNKIFVNKVNDIRQKFISLQHMKMCNHVNYLDIVKMSFSKITEGEFFDSKYKMIKVDYNNILQIKSKTMPIIIPFIVEDINGNVFSKKYLFKYDNIKKDYVVTKIIKLMIYLLEKNNVIKSKHIDYSVYMIDDNCGFIEIIDNAETIYDIKNKLNTTILNFILNNNGDKTISEVKELFINSLAIYSVITYLLGIGDRHLNNIMIHKNGEIFHIDFEFIMGCNPKFKTSRIRLTDDMIDAIGGKNSNEYLLFKNLCSMIFNCLRKYLDIIFAIIKFCIYDNDIDDAIINELVCRFEPGEKYIDAIEHISTIVDKSYDGITNTFFDMLHKFKNYV